jgi:predicted unusual protein kinase regulating ubiquinone biosynthesis (AarF/ABC1/UbiB family)
MTDHAPRSRPVAVPSGRFVRAARLGTLATGMASSAALSGLRAYVGGARPDWRDLLATPENMRRVADQLARMRGAAMKVGQLISMDAGDVLPPELAQVMARLRAEADHMPPRQLRRVLDAEWGGGWQRRFRRFDVRPVAAASIGQVHRAIPADGPPLAIKVQYPGIRRSIDSDVDNVATLIRLSGLVPTGLDLAPLLSEAKRQLHDEADYAREASQLARFGALLADDADFLLPEPDPALTTTSVLAMTYVAGQPVERLAEAEQSIRDRVMTVLVALLLRELFDWGVMQSDPNFANYRFDPETGRVILLDFGAARDLSPDLVAACHRLLAAGMGGGRGDIVAACEGLGLFAAETPGRYREAVTDMTEIAFAALRRPGLFDFAASDMIDRLRARGMALAHDRDLLHVPPVDLLYLQRKVGGLFLLGRTLGARIALRDIVGRYL